CFWLCSQSWGKSSLQSGIIEMAFDQTTVGGDRLRGYCRALWHDARTTRVEAASGRYLQRIGIGGTELRIGHAEARLRREHGGKQRLAVGVPRRPVEMLRLRLLDDAPQIHDGDARCHVLDHGQVMADQE